MAIEQQLRDLLTRGSLRIHLWATSSGRYQANVSEPGANAWTVVIDDDPVDALALALRQRAARVPDRRIEIWDEDGVVPRGNAQPAQIDIEEVIAAAASDDEFGALLG